MTTNNFEPQTRDAQLETLHNLVAFYEVQVQKAWWRRTSGWPEGGMTAYLARICWRGGWVWRSRTTVTVRRCGPSASGRHSLGRAGRSRRYG